MVKVVDDPFVEVEAPVDQGVGEDGVGFTGSVHVSWVTLGMFGGKGMYRPR